MSDNNENKSAIDNEFYKIKIAASMRPDITYNISFILGKRAVIARLLLEGSYSEVQKTEQKAMFDYYTKQLKEILGI